MVADIDIASAQAVAKSLIDPKTGEAIGSACKVDCSSEASLRRLIVSAEFNLGPIDVFVSNAGIPSNGGVSVPNEEWVRLPLQKHSSMHTRTHVRTPAHPHTRTPARTDSCSTNPHTRACVLSHARTLSHARSLSTRNPSLTLRRGAVQSTSRWLSFHGMLTGSRIWRRHQTKESIWKINALDPPTS